MEEIPIEILITPSAQPIEREDVIRIVGDLLAQVRAEGDWRPGKCCEVSFRRDGKLLVVALDFRADGSHKAFVALPEEITSHPTKISFMTGDGTHGQAWFNRN